MARLSVPLALANLGWMTMGAVDTMMVGRVGAEAMGAVSLGGVLFSTVGFFGSGLLLGLDTLVSQAFGAGKVRDCHRSLLNSFYFSVPLAAALMGVVELVIPFLNRIGVTPSVLHQAVPYLRALMWSTLPLLFYFALSRYLQSMNLVKAVTFALVTANLVNAAGNWVLIYGHLGAPAMGAEGSGWSTTISRVYMTVVLLVYALYHDRREGTGLGETPLIPDLGRIRLLVRLGLPAALQITLELAVFALASAWIARLDPIWLAGHQVALVTASLTYMVPLGVSSAAAVRVGQAIGRGDPAGARRAGWTAVFLGAAFMLCAALLLLLFPESVARVFTPTPAIVRAGGRLLAVAAFFQLFDGIQVVVTGALRGCGDTRTPMFCHLFGYWGLGLPLGYYLCFGKGWGAPGLWTGLCVALIVIGSVLFLVWRRRVRALVEN